MAFISNATLYVILGYKNDNKIKSVKLIFFIYQDSQLNRINLLFFKFKFK